MYLKNIRLWNFRKFGRKDEEETIDLEKPHLDLELNKNLNVLIGANDSGKSAIVDAIRYALKTHSYEWIKVEKEEFYGNSRRLRIELKFEFDGHDEEAKNFTEWLGWEQVGDKRVPYLRLIYDVQRRADDGKIIPTDVRAGVDDEGSLLDAGAKEYLKVTYLKPLRDAENELTPKRNSRLSQILAGHEAFKGQEKKHRLLEDLDTFNTALTDYFTRGKDEDGEKAADKRGIKLKQELDALIKEFYSESGQSSFNVAPGRDVRELLEKLDLSLEGNLNPGLGTLNRLFISSELLHLQKKGWTGLRLGLIEEIEAHLHPQAQMKILGALRGKSEVQLILTTHSPNIGSKVKLDELIVCSGDKVFPMRVGMTKLQKTDYTFLERFLDSTKANFFFANGVILVEGWSEEILLPAIAQKMGCDLTKKGVSVVNIGSTAFLRYASIFKRQDDSLFPIPISLVTDLDVKPDAEQKVVGGTTQGALKAELKQEKYEGGAVKAFISPHWTLEYCIARDAKLRKPFYKAVLQSLLEQKIDDGVEKLDRYHEAIAKIDSHFNSWADPEEITALHIYEQVLGERKILDLCTEKVSKAIVAQSFASIIESEIEATEITGSKQLKYIVDAIKYACRD